MLENDFPNYDFSKSTDVSEAYLRVKLNESRIDSLELKAVYEELIEIRKRTLPSGQPIVNWIYVVVYNREGEYLFTIVKNGDRIIFFEDIAR